VFTADIPAIAVESGLRASVINSGIIGLFAKTSQEFTLEAVLEIIKEEFSDKKPEANARAAVLAFQRAKVCN